MFSILYGTYFPFEMHFKMLSAICFNSDQSKILSSGNGLILYQKTKFVTGQMTICDLSKLKSLADNKISVTKN